MTVGGVLDGQKPSPTSFPGGEVVDFSYIAQLADRYQANTSSLIPPPFPTTAGFRFAIREILGVRFHFIFILIDSSFSFKSFNQKRSGKASPSLPLLKNSPTSLVIFKYSTDRIQTITPIFGTNYCLCLRPVPPGKLKVVLLPMELECFNASMAPSGISLSSIDSFYLLPAHKFLSAKSVSLNNVILVTLYHKVKKFAFHADLDFINQTLTLMSVQSAFKSFHQTAISPKLVTRPHRFHSLFKIIVNYLKLKNIKVPICLH